MEIDVLRDNVLYATKSHSVFASGFASAFEFGSANAMPMSQCSGATHANRRKGALLQQCCSVACRYILGDRDPTRTRRGVVLPKIRQRLCHPTCGGDQQCESLVWTHAAAMQWPL